MAKADKIEFSKFFPQTTSFVVVTGAAEGSDEFNISVEIGDGSDKVSFYLSDWFGGKNNVASLKAIQEGIQKALDFHAKVLTKPTVSDLSEGVEKKRVTRSTSTRAKKTATKKTK